MSDSPSRRSTNPDLLESEFCLKAMTSSIPSASNKGFQNALLYDQHRPSYPIEAVNSLLKRLRVYGINGARIVDLAAGTGKFTELLANREECYEVIAVEPHDEMRTQLQKKRLMGVQVLKGHANNMEGVESQSVDAVVASQVGSQIRSKHSRA